MRPLSWVQTSRSLGSFEDRGRLRGTRFLRRKRQSTCRRLRHRTQIGSQGMRWSAEVRRFPARNPLIIQHISDLTDLSHYPFRYSRKARNREFAQRGFFRFAFRRFPEGSRGGFVGQCRARRGKESFSVDLCDASFPTPDLFARRNAEKFVSPLSAAAV